MKNYLTRINIVENLLNPETGLFQVSVRESNGTEKLIQETKTKGNKIVKLIFNKEILANEKLWEQIKEA
ncbi:MAG: hypothetical protein IIC75_00880 [Bacteroidetes bacterium]|nr:hypothetical protein [Bacteroidota bacterium]